jgi:choline dehydrogenase
MDADVDYIVVGSGTAGSVVAHRLAAAGRSVLLLEAGREVASSLAADPTVLDPMRYGDSLHSDIDWAFYTVPQPELTGRKVYCPRGRAVGGTTNLNGMAYVRPALADFDGWAAAGCDGWDGAAMLPHLMASEQVQGRVSASGLPAMAAVMATRGTAGPQGISWADPARASPVAPAFIEACGESGYPLLDDYNAPGAPEGVGWLQLYQRGGVRATAAVEWVAPAVATGNLQLNSQCLVSRVMLEEPACGGRPRASGVEYVDGRGQQHTATAREQVVLCAGAYSTPTLLMHSGIGDKAALAEHGLEARVHNPNVGQNLQDHIWCPVAYQSKVPLPKEEYENHVETHLLAASSHGKHDGRRDVQVMSAHPLTALLIHHTTRAILRV